jgi:hypothetical protein
MEEKKADNRYMELSDRNKRNYDIDSKIDSEKSRIDRLDDFGECICALQKNLNDLSELISSSIKGGNVVRQIEALNEDNNHNISDMLNYVINEKNNSEAKIKELYKEKDKKEEKKEE